MLNGPKQVEWKEYGKKVKQLCPEQEQEFNHLAFTGQVSVSAMVSSPLRQHEVAVLP